MRPGVKGILVLAPVLSASIAGVVAPPLAGRLLVLLADSPMTPEAGYGQDSRGKTRLRRPRMDSLWSFYYWIDDFAGHFGTVVILGAMLAGSLYWLLSAR